MSRSTRTETITQTLRDEVLGGQYRPGERLPSERDLAHRFETTRDVVRVALKKLEQLGLADVQPGGSRVRPLGEASLEVIGHLLELESPPDPALVDQILELVGALTAANTRIVVERGQAEDLERASALIEQLRERESEDRDEGAWQQIVHQLAGVFLESNDNLVMRIVRRSLRTEILPRMHAVQLAVAERRGRSNGNALPEQLVDELLFPQLEGLARAIEKRDGLAAYEAVHQLWGLMRQHVRATLEAARGLEAAVGEGAASE